MATPRTPRTPRGTSPPRDRRILNLAAEASEARDRRLPVVLQKLKDILEVTTSGTSESNRIRKEIWDYNLMYFLNVVLKQDFSMIEGDWVTAASLISILSQVCVGLNLPKADLKEFEEKYLPETVENIFLVLRRMQARYAKIPRRPNTERERMPMLVAFKSTIDSLVYMVSGHQTLGARVMKSPWLLQLLITDEVDTVNSVMDLIQKIMRARRTVFKEIDEKTVFSVMDELIYKLTVNSEVAIAAAATKCVLRVCEYHKPMVQSLCTRYKGLRPLLGKWNGKGFGKDLKEMLLLLESGTAQKAETERMSLNAVVIQAWWRSFNTRRKLTLANKAFAKFQKSYRARRIRMEDQKLKTKRQSFLEYQGLLNRQRIMRDFRQRQLHTIEILPAAKVEAHLLKEQTEAALKIQTLFRGHRERKQKSMRQVLARQTKAAICIQRALRKWMDKMDAKRNAIPARMKPTGLTDERRVELMQDIQNWREQNPVKPLTYEELVEHHTRTSEKINRYYRSVKASRKAQARREVLLARLDTDSELIMLSPGVKEATQRDVDMYSSRSLPVATKAKANHVEHLRMLRQPWWKKLTDEFQDGDYEEEDYIIF